MLHLALCLVEFRYSLLDSLYFHFLAYWWFKQWSIYFPLRDLWRAWTNYMSMALQNSTPDSLFPGCSHMRTRVHSRVERLPDKYCFSGALSYNIDFHLGPCGSLSGGECWCGCCESIVWMGITENSKVRRMQLLSFGPTSWIFMDLLPKICLSCSSTLTWVRFVVVGDVKTTLMFMKIILAAQTAVQFWSSPKPNVAKSIRPLSSVHERNWCEQLL